MPAKKKPGPEPMNLLSRTRTTGISLRPYHRYVLSHAEASISDTIQFLIEKAAQEEGVISEEEFKQRSDAMEYARGHLPGRITLRHMRAVLALGWIHKVEKGCPLAVIAPDGTSIPWARFQQNPEMYIREHAEK